MVYLLTYDGYMREGYLEEICPSAILFMQCGLKDCALEFRRFYETAMPTLEVGDEIVPAVIWKLEESDLQNMEAICIPKRKRSGSNGRSVCGTQL